jgi:peptide deformylase
MITELEDLQKEEKRIFWKLIDLERDGKEMTLDYNKLLYKQECVQTEIKDLKGMTYWERVDLRNFILDFYEA